MDQESFGELPPAGGTSTVARERLIDLRAGEDPNETTIGLSEAAARIGVDRTTLLRHIRSGRMKGWKIPGPRGEQWVVPVTELAGLERTPEAPEPVTAPNTGADQRVLEQLSTTMERLIGELSQQRLAITAGEQRLADEREQRVRMEERLAAVQREHELALEVARREAAASERAAQEARDRAEAAAREAEQRAAAAEREAKERADAAARDAQVVVAAAAVEADRLVQVERDRLAAIEAERAKAAAREAELRSWAEVASKRRFFRKPPPPPSSRE